MTGKMPFKALLTNLSRRCSQQPLGKIKGARRSAAVLIPLCVPQGHSTDDLNLLFTKRGESLSSHKGEVSFPGGMHENEDVDLVWTALRETYEEIGVEMEKIEILGTLMKVPSKSGIAVTPVLGWLGEVDLVALNARRNKEEVAKIFTVPIQTLQDPQYFREDDLGFRGVIPRYKIPNQPDIWGLTGYLTAQVVKMIALSSNPTQT